MTIDYQLNSFNSKYNHQKQQSYLILVKGVLRGFGFKGFIYEKMSEKRLAGFIEDLDIDEIIICVEGPEESVAQLVNEIKAGIPYVIIDSIEVYNIDSCNTDGHTISIIPKDL